MYPGVVMVSAEPQWLLLLVISQEGWSKGTPVWRELLSPITEQKLIASWESPGKGSLDTGLLRNRPGSQGIFLRATLADEDSTPCPILRARGWD